MQMQEPQGMTMNQNKTPGRMSGALAGAALVASLLLAGCGGGGGNTTTTQSVPGTVDAALVPVPASASTSVASMIAYLKSLVSDETSPPLDVTNFAPPKPDDQEATAL